MFRINLLLFLVLIGAALPPAQAVIPSAAQNDPLYAKGYLVVAHYPGVTLNGDAATAAATTAALNEAIADAFAHNLVAYFPQGTYLVNDTLKAYTATGTPPGQGAAFATPREHLAIVGSTKGARPLIKLIDGADGFGSAASPKTILEFMNFDRGQIGNPEREAPASGYYQMLRGVDVHCGAGNAGAIGVYFNQAQGSSIEEVKVTATGALAGFKALPGRGAPVVNIEVEGGRYGIDTGGTSNIGTVVAGVVLRNQTISAVRHDSAFFPLVITGFQIITPAGSTQAAVTISGSAKSSGSALHLIDGSIILGGDPSVAAIDNRASRIFYARNVYITGSTKLVKSTNANPTIVGVGTWQLINEYSYCNQAPMDGDDKIAQDLIDGVVTRTPGAVGNGEVVNVTDHSSAPPADLVDRHAWLVQPSVDDGDAFDAFHAGIVPGNVSSEALQNVIDNHRKVFLRKGIYYLDGVVGHSSGAPIHGPITLRRDSVLFGAARHLTRIEVHPDWNPTSETAMIATDNDADATTFIGGLAIGVDATDLANDWFVALDWQAGRNSMVHIGHVYREPAFTNPNPRVTTNPHSLLWIRNSGGGRWYGAGARKNFTSLDPAGLFRILKVEGTTQPLWMYGLNLEGPAGPDTYAEFSNASNVRIYAVKTESAALPSGYADKNILLKYVNVTNLAQFGHSAIRDAATGRGTIEFLGAGTDRALATLISPQTGAVVANSDTLRENRTGLPEDNVGISFPNVVALYKRGEITAADEATMNHDAVSYAPVGGNTPPIVQITSPTNGAILGLLPTVVAATATDADGTVALVNFYANGAFIGSDADAPYSVQWTPAEVGGYSLTATAIDNEGAPTGSMTVTISTLGTANVTELVLNSIGTEDGRVIESTSTSEVGGNNFPNASGTTALRIGDDAANRQQKSIVSFDTSALPANAVVLGASLELNRGSGAQGNIGNLGALLVDIRAGNFGAASALENTDFEAPATVAQAATMSLPVVEGEWAVAVLNEAGRSVIGRAGARTQFRVRFAVPDNGNGVLDFIPFLSGASATPANRPILRLSYALAPAITTPPIDQTVIAGDAVTFAVAAAGASPLTYQWRRNGMAIAGNASAHTDTLTLPSVGTGAAGSYDCVVSNSIGAVTSAAASLKVAPAPGGPLEAVFESIGAEDGRVIESTATSEVGGNNFPNATGSTALRLGDDGTNRQFRNIVSFDTSTLPAGAVVVSASLELNRGSGAQGGTGNLGDIVVDIRTGSFGASDTLENVDFQFPATVTHVATMSVPAFEGNWSIGALNQAGRAAINRTGGRTQFRVYYSSGDNGNSTQDFIPFFGGASATAGTRPLLRIGYVLPPTIVTSPVDRSATVGDTVTLTVTASDAVPAALGYQWRKNGVPIGDNASAQTATLTLTGLTTAAAGIYDCVISNAAASATSAGASLTVTKALAVITLGGLEQVYDGAPRAVTAATHPAGLGVVLNYNGSPTPPADAGIYAVTATIADPNYFGSAAGTLTVEQAAASIVLAGLHRTYDGTPRPIAATTTPPGLTVNLTYDGSTTAPTSAGSYAVVATIASANYRGTTTGTLIVNPAPAAVTLAGLTQAYDGLPKPVVTSTEPADLAVSVTYDGSATAPTNPGSYLVVATTTDANHTGTASSTLVITITALVRHAPALNGGLDGSLQVLAAESFALNGQAWVSGDLLVPGQPTVQLNGSPVYGGTLESTGSASPSSYQITLNGNAALRHVVRRVEPIAMPTVSAPPAPTGTRNVAIQSASQGIGDPATLRNLTLNGNAGDHAIPAGTYGVFAANGSGGFILGEAGATTPAIYNLQGLTLNGSARLQVAGPVKLVLANGVSLGGAGIVTGEPGWLTLAVASGGVTLNGSAAFRGVILAPAGTVTINGNATLTGRVTSDRLTINGQGLLEGVDP